MISIHRESMTNEAGANHDALARRSDMRDQRVAVGQCPKNVHVRPACAGDSEPDWFGAGC
jgi:hypothetical protein